MHMWIPKSTPRPMKSTAKETEIRLKCPMATAVNPAVKTRPTTSVKSVAKTRRSERRAQMRMRLTSAKEAIPAMAAWVRTASISS